VSASPSPRKPVPARTLSPTQFGLILAGTLGLLVAIFHRDLRGSLREPSLVISEIMAVNTSSIADADGDFSEWIEIHNPQAQPQNLAGWHLTDDFRLPQNWSFPPLELPPGGFVVVFASGKNRTNRLDDLHTSFQLKRKGEYLALIQPDGRTVEHEYLPKYPPMEAGLSFGLRPTRMDPSGNGATKPSLRQHAFFVEPSPGATNRSEMMGRVADTKFSHTRGLRTDPLTLSISTATPGAEIRYTTDGSVPGPGRGNRYESPIPITATTLVRAAAFRQDFRPTDVDTLSFIFPTQVPRQDGTGFPVTWGVRDGEPVVADYAMDPDMVGDLRYRERLHPALLALPTLSLVVDRADLFDPATGIYANPTESGSAWERPASLEFLPSDGSRGVHINCGVRAQGGWSRRPEESPKHSFRLEFRDRYGAPNLKYPLLGSLGPKELKSLVLRAGCNNSWLHWSSRERRQGDLLRDEFMRETYRETGQLSARGRFVHLYLDGLYWGIYNACERPDESFLAAHWGGVSDDYESRNADKVLSGTEDVWNQIFALANAGLDDSGRYSEFQRLVDIQGFCNLMLVQIYGGTADWDAASNGYAGRRIRPTGKYQFFIWDSEGSLEAIDANILNADDDRSPTRLFQALRGNADFRAAFAVIARRNLGRGGALSAEASQRRYARLADHLRPAIVAESVRWGDYRRDVHPYREGPYELYTADDHWEPEVDRLLHRYFPARTQEVIRQLQEVSLY
jgi:CotH kinase protein/Lamin Tail Domain/Chitobiase/beta-hexosaminidase C-terminal domain